MSRVAPEIAYQHWAKNMKKGDRRAENCRTLFTTHGHTRGRTRSQEYQTWISMNQRCFDPNWDHYDRYGGRGITVCDEWRHDFEAFLAHIGPAPSKRHSIDRWPDKDGNYEPGNVRWASKKEQARNRDTTLFVQYNGERMLLLEACDRSGIAPNTARQRKHTGWPEKDWFIPLLRPRRKNAGVPAGGSESCTIQQS